MALPRRPPTFPEAIPRPWPRRRTADGWRYRPPLVTVWHREPGEEDSLTRCHGPHWQWHIHHWRLHRDAPHRRRRAARDPSRAARHNAP